MTCIRSLTICLGDSKTAVLFLERLAETPQGSVFVPLILCLCKKEKRQESVRALSTGATHQPSLGVYPPPTSQANPTSQMQHSPVNHMRATVCVRAHACVCVCVFKCPLLPQSLHGWIVAAAQLPASGSSAGSPSLHSLPALRRFCRGCQSQPACS